MPGQSYGRGFCANLPLGRILTLSHLSHLALSPFTFRPLRSRTMSVTQVPTARHKGDRCRNLSGRADTSSPLP